MTANVPQLMCNYFNSIVVAINSTLYTGSTNHSFGDSGLCDYNCGSGGILGPLNTQRVTVVGWAWDGTSNQLPMYVHTPDTMISLSFPWAVTYPWGLAMAINSTGTVICGYADNDSGYARAIVWDNFTPTDLGTLGGLSSNAYALSATGLRIVGSAHTGAYTNACYWDNKATATTIGTLGGHSSEAMAVSSNGLVIAGYSYTSANTFQHAFSWTLGGGIVDLGTLHGKNTQILGASSNGSVLVGFGYDATDTYQKAFVWTLAGGMVDIGTLGGPSSGANAVSSDGTVVTGDSTLADLTARAFKWTLAGGMVDISPQDTNVSQSNGVTSDGTLFAGSYNDNTGYSIASYSDISNGFQMLGTLGGLRSTAYGILKQ